MARPMRMEKATAPMTRAMPISSPSTRAVRMMARMLMAGPEYRKATAGPSPAPRLWMLENKGRMVQLHTANMVPDTEATV